MAHKPCLTPAKELAYANAEARRRWGEDGRAWHPDYEVRGGLCFCMVGVTDGYPDARRWRVFGQAPTFAEAWTDAESRGH